MRITLPFPSRLLSPNARCHWRAKQSPKVAAREAGYFAALEVFSPGNDTPLTGDLRLTYHIHPPDKRRRDLDNLVAASKPALDGVCKALMVDDSQIKQTVVEWGAVVPGGQVVMEMEEMP